MKENPTKRNPLVIFIIALISLAVLYLQFSSLKSEVPDHTNDNAVKFNFRFNPIVYIGMEITQMISPAHFIKRE